MQIVFPDCDLDAAVAGLVRSSFLNQGEICLCTSRIFVHSDILEPFLHRFVPAVAALKVGDPEEEETFCGAVNSKQHYEKVRFTKNIKKIFLSMLYYLTVLQIMSYIKLGREGGAVVHCGQGVTPTPSLPTHCRAGWFVQPTVLSGLPDSHPCLQVLRRYNLLLFL